MFRHNRRKGTREHVASSEKPVTRRRSTSKLTRKEWDMYAFMVILIKLFLNIPLTCAAIICFYSSRRICNPISTNISRHEPYVICTIDITTGLKPALGKVRSPKCVLRTTVHTGHWTWTSASSARRADELQYCMQKLPAVSNDLQDW